ncbi:MAG: hypothetical protein ACYCSA_00075 [Thermoplasmataceae archaeon]|jgi:hypothetical protein|nr:hypothetical protein [Candidatus Thermoplasmatota archaeon]
MNDISIPIGRGKITVSGNVVKLLSRGKYLTIRTAVSQSPCTDGLCQRIIEAEIALETPNDDENLRIFAGDGIFLGIDQNIFASVDRGREEVIIKKSLSGKLIAQGLVFTS